MHMLRADEVSRQSHCNLWWRWWWSDAMWETLIRLWLYELSYCLQVFVADISLQVWRYMESYDSVVGVCVCVCAGSWVFSTTGCAYIVWMKGTPGYAVNFSGLHFCWNALPNFFAICREKKQERATQQIEWVCMNYVGLYILWQVVAGAPTSAKAFFLAWDLCLSIARMKQTFMIWPFCQCFSVPLW